MRVSLRRRLRDDAGVSLVEMLIALVLLTVGLLALLSTLIASAHSLSSQRWATAANRVASAEFERLRALGYDDAALDSGTTPAFTVTLDGREYSIERTVSDMPADPGGTLSPDTIKRVELDVSWTDGGTARSRSFATAIAPPPGAGSGGAGGPVGDIVADPATAWVDEDTGETIQTITLTVPLVDTPSGSIVELEWEDDGGPHTTNTVYTGGAGVTFTFAPGDITSVIPAGDLHGAVEFTVTVLGTSKGHTVQLQREPDTPLALSGASISPSVIWLARPSPGTTCGDPGECRNLAAVTFSVDVEGFDTSADLDTVRVRYALHGGNYEEVSLVRTHVLGPTTSRWGVTLPAGAVRFDGPSTPGAVAHRTFTFIAIRTGDVPPTEAYRSITHAVGRQP